MLLCEKSNIHIYYLAKHFHTLAVMKWIAQMKEPYEQCLTVDSIKSFVNEGKRLSFDDTIPKKLKELIEMCWKENPIDRPKFDIIFRKLHDVINRIEQGNPGIQEIL